MARNVDAGAHNSETRLPNIYNICLNHKRFSNNMDFGFDVKGTLDYEPKPTASKNDKSEKNEKDALKKEVFGAYLQGG